MARTLYTIQGSGRSEIDLRAKYDELIYGTNGKIPHGSKVIIRNMRRDDNLKPTPCVCKLPDSQEPDPSCQYCLGEGFLFDEVWADTYSLYSSGDTGLVRRFQHTPPGTVRIDYKTFYFRYTTKLLYGDKIVEVKLDQEGRVVVPFKRIAIYNPETIQEYRSDYGRIEYIAARCKEFDAIRTDYY